MTATVSNTNITKATDSTPKEATSTIASQDVGLLFVREYYTFLNKKPHRLHAFYNKDSYFIRGDEGENVQTYQGQEEIRKKIEELNFEDCKVLVTQVDSQMSANDGILIQVLGEMCVMDGPSQKFSQTFFLAPQPNGYYVLNDIFRFLKDEVDIDYYTCEDDQQQQQQQQNKREEVISEQAPAVKEEIKQEQVPEPITTKVEEPAKKQEQEEKSIEPKVEEKETEKENIEEVKQVSQSKSSDEKKKKHHHPSSHKEEVKINGTADHSLKEANEKAASATTTESPAAAASPALTKPAAPKTWANVTANDPSKWGTQVSEAKGSVSPVTANVQTPKEATAQQPAPQQPAQQQPPQQQQPSQQQQQQPQQQQQSQQQSNQSNKEQRKDEVTNIFVKNVFSNINQDQLHEAFSKFGSIRSLNIVSNRNCAFVDFTTPEACQKALAQHKVNVGSSVVLAEERRQHGGGGGRYGGNRQQQSSGSGSGGNYRHQQGGNYRRNTGGGSGNNNSGRNAGSGGSGGNKSRSGGSGNNQK